MCENFKYPEKLRFNVWGLVGLDIKKLTSSGLVPVHSKTVTKMKDQVNFKKVGLRISHSMIMTEMRKMGFWNQVKGGQNNVRLNVWAKP